MKKPFLYALSAALYIVITVLTLNSGSHLMPKEDNILMPMAMLSFFVLSAAIMGFLFLSEPLKLFLENHKKEAVNFFLKTVGVFLCFVVIFFILVLLV